MLINTIFPAAKSSDNPLNWILKDHHLSYNYIAGSIMHDNGSIYIVRLDACVSIVKVVRLPSYVASTRGASDGVAVG